MQGRFGGRQPIGVVYNTSMSRPDAALALALLLGYEGKREARTFAVAVTGSGFGAAVFCDVLINMYNLQGRTPNSNSLLPVGLSATNPLPADSPMVKAAVERRDANGQPAYPRSIRRLADTADVAALLRNSLTGIQDGNAVMVLSAPATGLARSVELPGSLEVIAKKIKTLVVCDAPGPQDASALRQVLALWPTPVMLCGREIGDSLRFPGASLDSSFSWTPAHPVADAYRSYQSMPYDAPVWDMAAMMYAIHPEAGFFEESAPGVIQVRDDGRLEFRTDPAGKHKMMKLSDIRKQAALQAMVDVASAKPVPRPQFRRPPQTDAAKPQEKKTGQ